MDPQSKQLEFRLHRQIKRIPQPSAKRIIKKLRRRRLKKQHNQKLGAASVPVSKKASDIGETLATTQNEKIGLDQRRDPGSEILSLIKKVDYYTNLNQWTTGPPEEVRYLCTREKQERQEIVSYQPAKDVETLYDFFEEGEASSLQTVKNSMVK